MEEAIKLIKTIKSGDIKPIYFLMGDEPYYIDKISEYIEDTILKEDEKEFNQITLYGRDVTVGDIISNAKRYPMMAKYQVIIVKEAQDLSRHIEKMADYAKHPLPSTVLVVSYKYKSLHKNKALYKAIKKTGVVFESKKLYENQVAGWIKRVLMLKKYTITPKASQMLVEFLGNDLSKINNELEKLQIILPKETQITPEHVEENIGISKDFNNFELRKAIGEQNKFKAYQIINYFSENPRNHPIVLTVSLLFSFFSQLLHYHGLRDKSPRSVASALKINPYFVNEYIQASHHYPMKKVSHNISILKDIDIKSKGITANAVTQGDLLKEMVVKLMN